MYSWVYTPYNTAVMHHARYLSCVNTVLSFHMRSCEDESIDELAAYLGVGSEVAALTTQ